MEFVPLQVFQGKFSPIEAKNMEEGKFPLNVYGEEVSKQEVYLCVFIPLIEVFLF